MKNAILSRTFSDLKQDYEVFLCLNRCGLKMLKRNCKNLKEIPKKVKGKKLDRAAALMQNSRRI